MRLTICAAATIAAAALHSVCARADVIVTQDPCATCLTFTGDSGIDNWHRTLGLRTPGAGKAIVTANGSMNCFNTGVGVAGILIISQIVQDNEAVNGNVNVPAQGRLLNGAGLASGTNLIFNLASTRVFTIPAAMTTFFRLRLKRFAQAPGAVCSVLNVALTIDFRG